MSEFSSDPKWLPASPHREALLAFLADGRAHVVERGHGNPPLVVFEDGGAIEMPRIRYAQTERGTELVAADVPDAPDQTKHRDVCGTLDELEARIAADPAKAAAERHDLCRLARDVRHMLGRLQERRRQYGEFVDHLEKLAATARSIEGPDPRPALRSVDRLLAALADAAEQTLRDGRARLLATAEDIRGTANAQEKCLERHKTLALQVRALYEQIKGDRLWRKPDDAPRRP